MAHVVGALLLRETRVRFGRSQVGYLWAVLEPLGGVVIFATVMMLMERPATVGTSMTLFLALGMLGYNLFRRMTTQVGAAFDSNQALLTYPIVRPFDTLVARALLEVATGIASMFIIILGVMLIEKVPGPAHFETLVAGIAMLAMFGFGLGVINAVVFEYWPSWRQIEPLIHRPIFMVSGIFFVPNMLPQFVVDVLAWNPVLHGVEWLRYGYYDSYRSELIEFRYLVGWALGTTVVGLAAERFIPRRRV